MNKADIIQAAFRIWGRDLYQTTSLTQLARELGVSKPALYRHFKNKQTLLDAMYASFFDEYAALIKAGYERVLTARNKKEGLFNMVRTLAVYYTGNVYAFIFSLVQVYGSLEDDNLRNELAFRGVDLNRFLSLYVETSEYPPMLQMLTATTMFWTACFHKNAGSLETPPSESRIRTDIAFLEAKLSRGLGLRREQVEAIDYGALEQAVFAAGFEDAENDALLRAVAGAVAEAGPWQASMEMVARRSGLSKSGLYAHFKSRRDMLNRFFLTEFDRILTYAEANIHKSTVPEEQLYLWILSIANYFRTHPELLAALDWLRTRRIDLGLTAPPRLHMIFWDIKLDMFPPPEEAPSSPDWFPQWIIFMIINTPIGVGGGGGGGAEIPDNSVRILYRFITLGLEGFDP
ncbi:MAG: TetR/AcrR family transcriptional regulator [Treponema sp.]|nr:TetR/AcrR family transcriptional regulator [Treponema sp.]